MQIPNTVTVSPTSNTVTINTSGALHIESGGTLDLTGGTLTGDDNNALFKLNGGTLTTSATFSIPNIHLWIAAASTFSPSTSLTIGADALFTADVPHTFGGNVIIASGTTVTHSANSTAETYKINLTIGGDLTVTGDIDADGKGYVYAGPGKASSNATGSSYGGTGGGSSPADTYGSITAPVNIGSGGGLSYIPQKGAGAVQLTVTGTTTINGTISATAPTATAYNTGGGSGGSVYITTGSFAGSGTISANGGNSGGNASAGGGGGRIAFHYTTKTFDGTVTVNGGTGNGNGQAGTIFDRSDTDGPEYASFSPTLAASNTGIQISCSITDDESGVYDDATGSSGEGVYLKWGTESGVLSNEIQLNPTNVDGDGNGTYTVVSNVTGQEQGVTIYYKVYSYNNASSDVTEAGSSSSSSAYKVQSISAEQSIAVGDKLFAITVPEDVQVAGTAFEVTITAQETSSGSAVTDTTYSGPANITVEYVDPTSGTKDVTPASATGFSSGIATASLTYEDAGDIKIRVRDSVDNTITGLSNAVTLEPSSFTVTIKNSSGVESATLTSGQSFTIEVAAVSSTGATCLNYTGAVDLTTTYVLPTSGTLTVAPGTASITTGGIASVETAIFRDAQTISVTATETSTGTSGGAIVGATNTGTSDDIIFLPDHFDVILLSPPASRIGYYLNEDFNIRVLAKDSSGNITKNYRGTVSFTQTTGLSLPVSNYKYTSTDQGSHLFTGASGTTQGSYTIAIKDVTYTTITGTSTPCYIVDSSVIIPDVSGAVGTLEGALYINNDTTNAIISNDHSTIVTLLIQEATPNDSATISSENLTVTNGVALFTVTNTEAEVVTVSCSSITPTMSYTTGTFTFGSSTSSTSDFTIQYWYEVTTNTPTYDAATYDAIATLDSGTFTQDASQMSFYDMAPTATTTYDAGVTDGYVAQHDAMMSTMSFDSSSGMMSFDSSMATFDSSMTSFMPSYMSTGMDAGPSSFDSGMMSSMFAPSFSPDAGYGPSFGPDASTSTHSFDGMMSMFGPSPGSTDGGTYEGHDSMFTMFGPPPGMTDGGNFEGPEGMDAMTNMFNMYGPPPGQEGSFEGFEGHDSMFSMFGPPPGMTDGTFEGPEGMKDMFSMFGPPPGMTDGGFEGPEGMEGMFAMFGPPPGMEGGFEGPEGMEGMPSWMMGPPPGMEGPESFEAFESMMKNMLAEGHEGMMPGMFGAEGEDKTEGESESETESTPDQPQSTETTESIPTETEATE